MFLEQMNMTRPNSFAYSYRADTNTNLQFHIDFLRHQGKGSMNHMDLLLPTNGTFEFPSECWDVRYISVVSGSVTAIAH